MALTVYDRGGSGYANVNITTIHPGVNFSAAGTLAVVVIGYENSEIDGSDSFSSISDNLGNTYTPIFNVLQTPGSAYLDGCVLRMFYTYQDGGALTTSTNVTFSLGTNARGCVAWYEITGGGSVQISNSGSSGGSSTGPQITSSSVTSGDVVIGAVCVEYGATYTNDTDSTRGTFVAHTQYTNGTTTSGITLASSSKVTTRTGTQTYNISVGGSARDYTIGWIQIIEIASSFDPFGALGIFGI